MNNSRRKRIAAAFDQISKAKDLLSEVASEELDSPLIISRKISKTGRKGRLWRLMSMLSMKQQIYWRKSRTKSKNLFKEETL